MKVILKQSVPKVGKEGQVVNVKDGFARNYLFPRKMAVIADKAQLGVLARRNAKAEAILAETKSDADALREKLHGQVIHIPGQVAKESTKLFGAITNQDVADEIKKAFGVELEKKVVLLAQPIKQLGNHAVEIDAHRLVDIRLTVHVYNAEVGLELAQPEEPVAEEPVAEAAADGAEETSDEE